MQAVASLAVDGVQRDSFRGRGGGVERDRAGQFRDLQIAFPGRSRLSHGFPSSLGLGNVAPSAMFLFGCVEGGMGPGSKGPFSNWRPLASWVAILSHAFRRSSTLAPPRLAPGRCNQNAKNRRPPKRQIGQLPFMVIALASRPDVLRVVKRLVAHGGHLHGIGVAEVLDKQLPALPRILPRQIGERDVLADRGP